MTDLADQHTFELITLRREDVRRGHSLRNQTIPSYTARFEDAVLYCTGLFVLFCVITSYTAASLFFHFRPYWELAELAALLKRMI